MKRTLNRLTGVFEGLVWGCLMAGGLVAVFPDRVADGITASPYLALDGLSRVIWPYASLITLLVLRFSRRYLNGHHRIGLFFLRCTVFLLSVLLLTATDHMVIFFVCWGIMGWQMYALIGHKTDWPQARSARRLARSYFIVSSALLGGALVLLYSIGGTMSISDALSWVGKVPPHWTYLLFTCVFLAAMIQAGLYPVQGWLMSSMTAPTPASALMHAGFVNAGGILLTVFAPVFADQLPLMMILVAVGGLSAMMGKVWKMVQSVVKRQLACSTVAQMGFMLLQCGLGFFSAAITHLILHGFYKGYLFLNTGSAIKQTAPGDEDEASVSVFAVLETLITAAAAGALFVVLTGKGQSFDSGVVLTFLVVLTVLHGSNEFVTRTVSTRGVHVLFPVVALISTALYGATYVGITAMMQDVPMVTSPTPLTWVHALLIGAFGVTFVLFEAKYHRHIPWLYVRILNASQPHRDTLLASREDYHV